MKNIRFLKYNLFFLLIYMIVSCSKNKAEPVASNTISNIEGKWLLQFYVDNIEQKTKKDYFWTFSKNNNFSFNDSLILSQDNLIQMKLKSKNKFNLLTFKEFTETSIDYASILKQDNITSKELPYFLDIGNFELTNIYSNTNFDFGYGLPLGVKSIDNTSIILNTYSPQNKLEIRLIKQ